MEKPEYKYETDRGNDKNDSTKTNESFIFIKEPKNYNYYEIYDNTNKIIKMIFGSEKGFNVKKSYLDKIQNNNFKEIIIIFDFNNLAEKLLFKDLEALLKRVRDTTKAELSLIIKNCLLNEEEKDNDKYEPQENFKLKKLEIDDELYSFSPNIYQLFKNFKAKELILKKFKFNSKDQLNDFSSFIESIECNKLTLDDFFIELIIKKNEDDNEYNDLDIYFTLSESFITFNQSATHINSLTLRDCPLFAIVNDLFYLISSKNLKLNIDIDQNSLLNPSIITKFKIKDGQCDICFDLDSYKLRLEEEEKNCDYVDLLYYIFNIINPNWKKKKEDEKPMIEDTGVNNLNPKLFHKLIFKNFDTTKYEFITGEDVTYIDEDNWELSEEEEIRRKKFEDLKHDLDNADLKNFPPIKELVFDNCSNFFIQRILNFLKGKDIMQTEDYDFDLIKLKKCGKDLVDITRILLMKTKKLILFDTPLIITGKDNKKKKEEKYLSTLKSYGTKMGSVDYLTLKLNSLDCYGSEYNLNIMQTYEILVELIECPNFNKNLIFEMNALSGIMTYLAYKTYVKNQSFYNNQNGTEDGKDDIDGKQPEAIEEEYLFKEDVNYLPKYIFFTSKKHRDYIYPNAFKLNMNLTGPITIKNTTIKRCYENYENQNYLIFKKLEETKKNDKKGDSKSYTTNKELRKMDFGSDGFYIDRDYKYFFYENDIKNVILENVAFSTYKDNNLESKEERNYETIINLIGKNKNGFGLKKYEDDKNFSYPNYIMDVKTFHGIFFRNYGYDHVSTFFKQYNYKTKSEEIAPLYLDISTINRIFDKFKSNIKNLSIIINNLKEQKEFYVMSVILDFITNKENKISNKDMQDKNKKNLETKIGKYFTKEKNENDNEVYSEFNYYYMDEGEEIMRKEGKVKINGYKIDIDFRFNYFEDDV